MSTSTAHQTTTPEIATTAAREPFDPSGLYFKYVACATFIAGLYFHVTRLFIGTPLTAEHVVTPTVDKIFFWPMAYAAVTGWLVWSRVVHPSHRHKIVYRAIIVYLTISLPLHLSTYFTDSTQLLFKLPGWYSVLFCAMVGAMLVFTWRLRIRPRG